MPIIRSYEVTLRVTGPVKTREEIRFNTDKELKMGAIFASSIEVKPDPEGFHIVVTVFTSLQEQANKIALLFVGRMLDCLSIMIKEPLFVSLVSDWKYTKQSNQKVLLQKRDFQVAFEMSRVKNDKLS